MSEESAAAAADAAADAAAAPTARAAWPPGAVRAVAVVSIATLLAMSAWFAATFVLDQLRPLLGFDSGQAVLLTVAVQIGFAVGALLLSAFGLADRVPERYVFASCACAAACMNLVPMMTSSAVVVIASRFLVGLLLAGVYPVAIALVSTWVPPRSRGWALGLVLGALTVGSAMPHLVAATAPLDWRTVLIATSLLTACGGVLVLSVRGDGPWRGRRQRFSLRAAMRAITDRRVRLVILAYLGHMWELYALWAAIGAFFVWRFSGGAAFAAGAVGGEVAGDVAVEVNAALLAFAVIGVGALGCIVGGAMADRRGSAAAAAWSLFVSGSCAVLLALSESWAIWLVAAIALLYGFSVIADSAQFSALISHDAPHGYLGTVLAFQQSAGFSVTAVSILITPWVISGVGWSGFFLVLAIGPAVGLLALFVLHVPMPRRRRRCAESRQTG